MSNLFMDTQHWRHQRRPRSYDNNNKNHNNYYACNGSAKQLPYIGSESGSTASHNRQNGYHNVAKNAEDESANDDDTFANVLSLKLRKPKHWNWELTTSRSCSNIALPRILLYDHKGDLLIDADNQSEQTFRSCPPSTRTLSLSTSASVLTPASVVSSSSRKRANKAATTNLAQSIRKAIERQFSTLQIQEATPSPTRSLQTVVTTPSTEHSSAPIDFYSNELPDYKLQRRAHSLKGVRFNVEHSNDANSDVSGNGKATSLGDAQSLFNIADLPTPPSTVTTNTTATPTNSSSSGPTREKRRYRRSHSSGRSPAHSESILERFSYNKGRFSSPEYAMEHEVYHPPRYFLSTSRAGTLIVQEESFSRCRRRRKTRNSSTENMVKSAGESGSKSSVLGGTDAAQRQCASSTQNLLAVPTSKLMPQLQQQTHARSKAFPIRRFRSDGNVLLHKQFSTSDEEQQQDVSSFRSPQRKHYNSYRKQSRKDLLKIKADNALHTALDAPTAR